MIGARQLDWSFLTTMYLYKYILFVFWFVARHTRRDSRAENVRFAAAGGAVTMTNWLTVISWQLFIPIGIDEMRRCVAALLLSWT